MMQNPGIRNLGDVELAAINAAASGVVVTSLPDVSNIMRPYADRLDGILAAAISANFVYAAGGDTLKVMIDTSLNQGVTWIEVARLAFAQASVEKVANLSALTPVPAVYSPAALTDDTVKDGIFGSRWRARILKGAGAVYTGQTFVSIRLHAR